MTSPIRCPDGLHGVIVVHAFDIYREADFLDDPELIDRLVARGEGWRFNDAVRLDEVPGSALLGADISLG